MDEPLKIVDLCGKCERGRCEFFVKCVPGRKERVLTCTKKAEFISSLPGFLEVQLVYPPSERNAQFNELYCTFCEALVFGEQAPGFQFETEQIVCQDCLKQIDRISTRRPRCHHLGLIAASQFVHTNHSHWLALPKIDEQHVEVGVYCDENTIPCDQRVAVGVWHCFKLKDADLEFVRSVFDQVGLNNEILYRLIHTALKDSFETTLEDFFLYQDG